jgi:cytochrome oxidase Cu insertion factor (SCO1/SenC/PrrC family)
MAALPPAHEAGPEEQVPTLGAAPDIALTSQHGNEVRLEDFCGNVVAVSFIYASCPDVCPLFSDKKENPELLDADLAGWSLLTETLRRLVRWRSAMG